MTSRQLAAWAGAFGNAYIERNRVTDSSTADATVAFSRMLAAIPDGGVRSILEVGANVGINLTGLRELRPETALAAVEPNPSAASVLRASSLDLRGVVRADGAALPFATGAFDLVFTNGVLIHVPPDRLAAVMREITRVSSTYVLCSEYFSHVPEEVPYHGEQGLLWKRDFGLAYLETCPGLEVVDYGFLWQPELPTFDDLTWWLFRVPPA